jgi:RNA polymerase sigma factor (sigma-70 family)
MPSSKEIRELLLSHTDSVRNYVAAQLTRPGAPDCSVDDILLEVWTRSIAAFSQRGVRDVGDFENYFITVAATVLVDRIRHESARKHSGYPDSQPISDIERSMSVILEELVSSQGHSSSDLSMKDGSEVVHRVLSLLPEAEAEAIRLHFIAGLDYEEVAKYMHQSRSSVLRLIARGMDKLQSEIGPVERFLRDVPSDDTSIKDSEDLN